jgi:hypothetical protein
MLSFVKRGKQKTARGGAADKRMDVYLCVETCVIFINPSE